MVNPQAVLAFLKISFLVVSWAGFEDNQCLCGLCVGYDNKLGLLGQWSNLKLLWLFENFFPAGGQLGTQYLDGLCEGYTDKLGMLGQWSIVKLLWLFENFIPGGQLGRF